MLRLHFVFILLGRSHFLRTHTEPIASLQQFLGVTLVNIIFGDNLRCTAGRLSSSLASNSSISLGPVTLCILANT